MSDLDVDQLRELCTLAEAHALQQDARVLNVAQEIAALERKRAEFTAPPTAQTSYSAALAMHHYAEWTRREVKRLAAEIERLAVTRSKLTKEAAVARARMSVLQELHREATRDAARRKEAARLEEIAIRAPTSPGERYP